MDVSSNNMSDMQIAASYAAADLKMVSQIEPQNILKEDKSNVVVESEDDSSDSEMETEPMRTNPIRKSDKGDEGNDMKDPMPIPSHPIKKVDVTLNDNFPMREIGNVLHINRAERTITIQSDVNKPILDENCILCLSDRSTLGCVDETFGPVTAPLYLIRYEAETELPKSIELCARVSVATDHASYLNPDNLCKNGKDADSEDENADSGDEELASAARRSMVQNKRKRNVRNNRDNPPPPPPNAYPPYRAYPPYHPPHPHHQPYYHSPYPPPPPNNAYSYNMPPNGQYYQPPRNHPTEYPYPPTYPQSQYRPDYYK